MTSETSDTSWLDSPPQAEAAPRIQAARSLTGERTRGKVVSMLISGKGRNWHSDGKYIWFRRKKANPATTQRLDGHVAKGEIKFIVTSDDVEMYEVTPKSPFYRVEQSNMQVMEFQTVFWISVRAAKKHDWSTFVDGLQEIAARVKGRVYSDGQPADGNFAKLLYQEKLTHLFRCISMAGGPSREEIDQGVANIRLARGEGRGSQIILPPVQPIARANRVR